MRFLIGLVCVIALFGAGVYAQDRCELCKEAVGLLRGEITEESCRDTVSSEAEDMCPTFAAHVDLLSDALQTTEMTCEALDFCRPPRPPSSQDVVPISDSRHNFDRVVKGVARATGEVVQEVAENAPIVATGAAVGLFAWLIYASPMLLLGRRKRDLAATERNTAGIHGEEEDNPVEYMDPTLDPSANLLEETDAYMKQAASSLKCELCKLGIPIDSVNATLLQTSQDGAPMRKLLCRSLPEKRDQRKCMTVLRQASEIFLQILGSLFGSLETCEGLKSCQVG